MKGKRVLVTRARAQAGVLSRALKQAGAVPVEVPAIVIAPPDDPEPFQRAVADMGRFDWLVLTSVNGVDAFSQELQRQGGDMGRLQGVRVAAIGPATSEALKQTGVPVDVMPGQYRGEQLARAMVLAHGGQMTGVSVLLARAAGSREALPEMLRQAGASVQVVQSYQALLPDASEAARLRGMMRDGELDAVTFTSSSTVRHTIGMLGEEAVALLSSLTIASIGPISTETAQQCGLRVDVTASQYTVEGLVEALRAFFERQV